MSTKLKTPDLKPCPHCGSRPEYDSQHWNGRTPVWSKLHTGHAIYCSGECSPSFSTVHETQEEAIEWWNKRAIQQNATASVLAEQMPGTWKCDKCGFIQQINNLYVSSGTIGSDNTVIDMGCPNDGALMRPLTWREANEDLYNELLKRTPLIWQPVSEKPGNSGFYYVRGIESISNPETVEIKYYDNLNDLWCYKDCKKPSLWLASPTG